ncbi:head maturation protease, ClpP-related [Rhodococcus pyridinivorans]|uniref:head maturation protease, ClpP-related n=1 Tax=Rhodococcus pyridinivorans TaxID=103816 RepID=UPI001D14C277|nr:head maturation protease, ClpP-related [Rhodococcus pyridinivorans]
MSLRLYDPIDSWGGYWGISAKEFVDVLDELPDDTSEIRLLINSPGGEVWEALAILNSLRAHPAKVVAVVEGIAASSASFIAAGVDELHVMANSKIFVHKAWSLCVGNGDDMAKSARDLEHEDRNIAAVYAAKAGGTVEDWLQVMADDTWYSADEAVAAGLADSVVAASGQQDIEAVEQANNRFDLSIFNRADGDRRARISSAAEAEADKKEGPMATLKETLAERLGIEADADDDTIVAALDEALDERAEPAESGAGTPGASVTAAPSLDQAVAAIRAAGLVAVEQGVVDDLRAKAERGDQARAQQIREANEAVVDAAIRDGKIPPARRDHWVNAMAADAEGTKSVLDGMEKGLIPYAEAGHSVDTDTSEGDEVYASLFGKEA